MPATPTSLSRSPSVTPVARCSNRSSAATTKRVSRVSCSTAVSIPPWPCSASTRKTARPRTWPQALPATTGTAPPLPARCAARASRPRSAARYSAACSCLPATPTTPPNTWTTRRTKARPSAPGRPNTCCGYGATTSCRGTGARSALAWALPRKAIPWVTSLPTT
ncbi:hypothetical protein D3C76_865680 [compost metagenome]